jgi:hypothetical protein
MKEKYLWDRPMWTVVRRNASNRETKKKEKLRSNKSATMPLCACAVVFTTPAVCYKERAT